MSVFGPRYSSYSNYLCHATDIAEVKIIFNVLGHSVVLGQDLPSRQRAYILLANVTWGGAVIIKLPIPILKYYLHILSQSLNVSLARKQVFVYS